MQAFGNIPSTVLVRLSSNRSQMLIVYNSTEDSKGKNLLFLNEVIKLNNIKPKFELQLKIIDLNNVPLVSGTSYVKWHLPSSAAAEHRGRTDKAHIRDHKVIWDYEKTFPVRLTVDRHGMLHALEIHFEVLQEYSSSARGERIILGNVKLNLAEYIDGSDDGEGPVTRRYLMQESKINSTLKICIMMKQTEGDRNFFAPPLKTAPVFGGIAGIITAEQGEPDDLGHIPSLSTKSRETGELQDIYRRALAASWLAQPGELPADECIEDIFSGGDGWGPNKISITKTVGKHQGNSTEDVESEGDTKTLRAHKRQSSKWSWHSDKKQKDFARSSAGMGHFKKRSTTSMSGTSSIDEGSQSTHSGKKKANYPRANEVDELALREDLRSWEISASG